MTMTLCWEWWNVLYQRCLRLSLWCSSTSKFWTLFSMRQSFWPMLALESNVFYDDDAYTWSLISCFLPTYTEGHSVWTGTAGSMFLVTSYCKCRSGRRVEIGLTRVMFMFLLPVFYSYFLIWEFQVIDDVILAEHQLMMVFYLSKHL